MLLDRYIAGNSPLHRMDARIKLVLTVWFIIAAALLPPGTWLSLCYLGVLVWLLMVLSGIRLSVLLRRSLVGLPFVLVASTLIFTTPGEPVLRLPVGVTTLTATSDGLVRFGMVLGKSWVALLVAVVFASTTPVPLLLHALHRLGVPLVLVTILGFMYRYLFMLVDEAHRLQRARMCRSAASDQRSGGTIWWRARVTGSMVGTLLVRAFERSERVYVAMLSRGYTGEVRLLDPPVLRRSDVGIGFGAGLVLALIVLQAYLERA